MCIIDWDLGDTGIPFWLVNEPSHPSTLNMCAQVCSYVRFCVVGYVHMFADHSLLITSHGLTYHFCSFRCSWLKDDRISMNIKSYHIPHFIEPICSPRCRNRSPSCSFYPQVSDHRSSLIDGSPVDRSIPSGLRALGSLATLSTQRVQLGRAGRFETHKKYHRNI